MEKEYERKPAEDTVAGYSTVGGSGLKRGNISMSFM